MGDFPSQLISPPGGVIHSSSLACLCSDGCLLAGLAFATGAAWTSANLAVYVPFMVEVPVTAYQIAFEVTTQSGNYDVGIYDELGNRLVSKGSTTVPVAGVAATDITDTPLTPGVYYMALCIDNTTAAVTRTTGMSILQLRTYGVQHQAVGAVTLPNPATFANPAGTFLPGLSVALKSTI